MWNRSDMKTRAKASLKGVFWMSVLVVVIYTLLTGGESSNITYKFGQEASSSIDLGNSGLDKVDALRGQMRCHIGNQGGLTHPFGTFK